MPNSNNKRIAKNTLYMYIRMLITMVVGLYTSRIVLATLGTSDFGLYNVIGGIVVVLASINGTLATGTQRFLSYAIGENNETKLNTVFSTAVLIHLIFAIILFIIAETIGLWFLCYEMNIPAGRETAAFWVYQFSIVTTVINIVQVPYMSAIIAHERMNVYAYMSIYDVVAKLLVVYLILVAQYDKLIFYAAMICVVSTTSALLYNVYCRSKFPECKLHPKMDRAVFREMAFFSSWNIFGCVSVPLQTQGLNILLNIFFNTIVNAARGIAVQINNIIIQFVNNFQTAVNPQIVKLYAAGEKKEMIHLVINNSKFAGFLYLFIAVPLFIEIKFVLDLWLVEYPEYTIPFVRIVLIQSLIQTLTRPVVMVVHAVGKMKGPNLTAGIALLLAVPLTYVLLKVGLDPVTVFAINLAPWVLETFFELYFENKYIGFPIWGFYKKVYLVVFPIALLLVSVPYLAHVYLPMDGWGRFLIVCIISVITSAVTIYYLGLSKHLREMVLEKAKSFVTSKIHR